MKVKHLAAVLLGFASLSLLAADASAMYNPSTGTWMQRDPGPGRSMRVGAAVSRYADGMNLYQYCGSSPPARSDPQGTAYLSNAEKAKWLTDEVTMDFAPENEYGKFAMHVDLGTRYGEQQIAVLMRLSFTLADKFKGCCDRLEFLQFIRMGSETKGKVGYEYLPPESRSSYMGKKHNGWFVDADDRIEITEHPEPWYPFVEKGDNGMGAEMADAPGASAPVFSGSSWQQFVTCAVCVEGMHAADGIKTYGCFLWGWYSENAGRFKTNDWLIDPRFSDGWSVTDPSYSPRGVIDSWNEIEPHKIPTGGGS